MSMTVEELIEKLQKMPPHYEVVAFFDGIEIDDFESAIFGVEADSEHKQVRLEIQQN